MVLFVAFLERLATVTGPKDTSFAKLDLSRVFWSFSVIGSTGCSAQVWNSLTPTTEGSTRWPKGFPPQFSAQYWNTTKAKWSNARRQLPSKSSERPATTSWSLLMLPRSNAKICVSWWFSSLNSHLNDLHEAHIITIEANAYSNAIFHLLFYSSLYQFPVFQEGCSTNSRTRALGVSLKCSLKIWFSPWWSTPPNGATANVT